MINVPRSGSYDRRQVDPSEQELLLPSDRNKLAVVPTARLLRPAVNYLAEIPSSVGHINRFLPPLPVSSSIGTTSREPRATGGRRAEQRKERQTNVDVVPSMRRRLVAGEGLWAFIKMFGSCTRSIGLEGMIQALGISGRSSSSVVHPLSTADQPHRNLTIGKKPLIVFADAYFFSFSPNQSLVRREWQPTTKARPRWISNLVRNPMAFSR